MVIKTISEKKKIGERDEITTRVWDHNLIFYCVYEIFAFEFISTRANRCFIPRTKQTSNRFWSVCVAALFCVCVRFFLLSVFFFFYFFVSRAFRQTVLLWISKHKALYKWQCYFYFILHIVETAILVRLYNLHSDG